MMADMWEMYDREVCLHCILYVKPLEGFKDKDGYTEFGCKQESFEKLKLLNLLRIMLIEQGWPI